MNTGLRAACPHCAAVFQLTAAQMEAREGLVRCGACRQVFNAKWHLVEPGGGVAGVAGVAAAGDGGDNSAADGGDDSAGDSGGDSADDSAPRGPAAPADAAPGDTADSDSDAAPAVQREPGYYRRLVSAPGLSPLPTLEPSLPHAPVDELAAGVVETFARRPASHGVDRYLRPRAHPLAGLLWGAAALALVALLGAQVKYVLVERYASHETLRPYLAAFCDLAACRLPPRHDSRRITLTRTHIDLHPRRPGALRVTVKLVNEATFAQPYPRLRLTLTDRDGWVVGRRTYAAPDYLNGRRNHLRSGELSAIFLDLAHPHEKAVGFEIDVVGGVF